MAFYIILEQPEIGSASCTDQFEYGLHLFGTIPAVFVYAQGLSVPILNGLIWHTASVPVLLWFLDPQTFNFYTVRHVVKRVLSSSF